MSHEASRKDEWARDSSHATQSREKENGTHMPGH